jgi:hypothetical protein
MTITKPRHLKSTATARRFHIRTYVVCRFWVFRTLAGSTVFSLYQWYANRFSTEREALVKQTEQNREVLQQLSKSRRTLELVANPQKPNRKLLIMKEASGWQTAAKQGVIEFDE